MTSTPVPSLGSDETRQTIACDSAPSAHPASEAWARLFPSAPPPVAVRKLQQKAKGSVYLLEGVGPDGAPVVAKCSSPTRIEQERALYEHVLPALPFTTVRYFGSIVEREQDRCWLFIADARGEPYEPASAAHRQLAAQWLARLHTSSARLGPSTVLPDRGPPHYLTHLQAACDKIVRHRGNPALATRDGAVLDAIVDQCQLVASHWSEVERLCRESPKAFVHGDFAPKNMRVRVSPRGLELVPFDWGSAGWGSLGVDLVQWSPETCAPWNYWANPDLATYRNCVHDIWPELGLEQLQGLATIGRIFRCLVCVALTAQSFATPWVERAMRNMRIYRAEMTDAVRSAGWQGEGTGRESP